jgi:intracellular sulfur oxidation DsrE/DsrF family protein
MKVILLRSKLVSSHQFIPRRNSVIDKNNMLHIDIPVVMDQVKTVFSVASLSFEKDLPAALFHMGLIVNDVADWKAKADIVAVFHTNAGHVTLHDKAYNKERNISTGNPYRKLVTDLMEKGVRVELCGATAKAYGWVNADTISGIQINTDAMSRLIQLAQEGFIKISES